MPKKKYKKQAEKAVKKYWFEILCVILALVIIFVVCYYTIDAFKMKVDGWIAAMSQPSDSGDDSNSDTNVDTDGNTGVIHESFNVNDCTNYTRDWFAWQNTLFGELILKLVNEGKLDLLNSIK